MKADAKLQVGDIYLTRFHPSTGKELKKYRPAVIINIVANDISSHYTLIAPLTSKVKNRHTSELAISNPALVQESALLCWYLWTIDKSRLIKKLGSLSHADQERMRETVLELFT